MHATAMYSPAPPDPIEDDRPWEALTPAERRARLAELSHADLLDEALRFAEDADMAQAQLRRATRVRGVMA